VRMCLAVVSLGRMSGWMFGRWCAVYVCVGAAFELARCVYYSWMNRKAMVGAVTNASCQLLQPLTRLDGVTDFGDLEIVWDRRRLSGISQTIVCPSSNRSCQFVLEYNAVPRLLGGGAMRSMPLQYSKTRNPQPDLRTPNPDFPNP
jgi:hypothetical protein